MVWSLWSADDSRSAGVPGEYECCKTWWNSTCPFWSRPRKIGPGERNTKASSRDSSNGDNPDNGSSQSRRRLQSDRSRSEDSLGDQYRTERCYEDGIAVLAPADVRAIVGVADRHVLRFWGQANRLADRVRGWRCRSGSLDSARTRLDPER